MSAKLPWLLLLGENGVALFMLAPTATEELSLNVEMPCVGSVGVGMPMTMTLTLTAVAP